MATESIEAGVESVDISDDAGNENPIGVQSENLDQATLFLAVQEGNAKSVGALLRNRKVDVNAYNAQGATALHLAVYKYEVQRNVDVVTTLLQHGADVSIKAAPPPSAHKISIVRHDGKHHAGPAQETKKISFDHKTALLIALELKSSLYLKGWEYRHWDTMISILADATIKHFAELKVPTHHPHAVSHTIQQSWDAVFKDGKHELVELVAESKDIVALKLLVVGPSKILRLNLQESNRMELHDTSYNLAKALVHYLYVGTVDPAFAEHRGIDLFVTAHKYGVECLKHVLEASIVPTQDNWIKLLTAAVETNSNVLTLKVAHSLKDVMEGRQKFHHTMLQQSFSDVEGAPQQLFGSSHKN
ncbi:unnamed protein product [Calypogeia fissa]